MCRTCLSAQSEVLYGVQLFDTTLQKTSQKSSLHEVVQCRTEVALAPERKTIGIFWATSN